MKEIKFRSHKILQSQAKNLVSEKVYKNMRPNIKSTAGLQNNKIINLKSSNQNLISNSLNNDNTFNTSDIMVNFFTSPIKNRNLKQRSTQNLKIENKDEIINRNRSYSHFRNISRSSHVIAKEVQNSVLSKRDSFSIYDSLMNNSQDNNNMGLRASKIGKSLLDISLNRSRTGKSRERKKTEDSILKYEDYIKDKPVDNKYRASAIQFTCTISNNNLNSIKKDSLLEEYMNRNKDKPTKLVNSTNNLLNHKASDSPFNTEKSFDSRNIKTIILNSSAKNKVKIQKIINDNKANIQHEIDKSLNRQENEFNKEKSKTNKTKLNTNHENNNATSKKSFSRFVSNKNDNLDKLHKNSTKIENTINKEYINANKEVIIKIKGENIKTNIITNIITNNIVNPPDNDLIKKSTPQQNEDEINLATNPSMSSNSNVENYNKPESFASHNTMKDVTSIQSPIKYKDTTTNKSEVINNCVSNEDDEFDCNDVDEFDGSNKNNINIVPNINKIYKSTPKGNINNINDQINQKVNQELANLKQYDEIMNKYLFGSNGNNISQIGSETSFSMVLNDSKISKGSQIEKDIEIVKSSKNSIKNIKHLYKKEVSRLQNDLKDIEKERAKIREQKILNGTKDNIVSTNKETNEIAKIKLELEALKTNLTKKENNYKNLIKSLLSEFGNPQNCKFEELNESITKEINKLIDDDKTDGEDSMLFDLKQFKQDDMLNYKFDIPLKYQMSKNAKVVSEDKKQDGKIVKYYDNSVVEIVGRNGNITKVR